MPPLAKTTGAARAESAYFTLLRSANALPQRIREECSISAVMNPLFICDLSPILSPILGL